MGNVKFFFSYSMKIARFFRVARTNATIQVKQKQFLKIANKKNTSPITDRQSVSFERVDE